MSENRDFKGIWIPKDIWIDENLTWTEKLMLVEIDSLEKLGQCFATNEHFALFFKLSKDRISKIISLLTKKGYIESKLIYREGTKQVEKRVMTTIGYRRKQLEALVKNNYTPIGENDEDSNTVLISTINNKDTLSCTQDDVNKIINYLNDKIGSNFKSTTNKTVSSIRSRFKEGFVIDDFYAVIDKKSQEWINDDKMSIFLRPLTLFGTKFESYLNQKDINGACQSNEEYILKKYGQHT